MRQESESVLRYVCCSSREPGFGSQYLVLQNNLCLQFQELRPFFSMGSEVVWMRSSLIGSGTWMLDPLVLLLLGEVKGSCWRKCHCGRAPRVKTSYKCHWLCLLCTCEEMWFLGFLLLCYAVCCQWLPVVMDSHLSGTASQNSSFHKSLLAMAFCHGNRKVMNVGSRHPGTLIKGRKKIKKKQD